MTSTNSTSLLLQIQGPKSAPLMEKMFGSHIREIPYYGLIHETLNGHPVTISRTGFSAEVGFEIYLHNAMLHADDVWPYILEQGEEFNLGVIAPSHIRRIEAGILSYGQDMDIENNPYEVRLGWQVDLDKGDFIGKEALTRIKQEGVNQRLVGLRLGGEPIVWYNEDFYSGQRQRLRRRRRLRHQRLLVPGPGVQHRLGSHAPLPLETRHPGQSPAPCRQHRRRRGRTASHS